MPSNSETRAWNSDSAGTVSCTYGRWNADSIFNVQLLPLVARRRANYLVCLLHAAVTGKALDVVLMAHLLLAVARCQRQVSTIPFAVERFCCGCCQRSNECAIIL